MSLRLEEYFKEKAKANQVRTEENRVLQKSAEQKIDTRAELAKIAGVSHGTFSKVAWQYSPKSQNGTLVGMILFQKLHSNVELIVSF